MRKLAFRKIFINLLIILASAAHSRHSSRAMLPSHERRHRVTSRHGLGSKSQKISASRCKSSASRQGLPSRLKSRGVRTKESEHSSSEIDITLDPDGRVPAGLLPDDPKPPDLNYGFRSFDRFLDLDRVRLRDEHGISLIEQCIQAFTAKNQGREGYSRGETYLLRASDVPSCPLEVVVKEIFDFHTAGLVPDVDFNATSSGLSHPLSQLGLQFAVAPSASPPPPSPHCLSFPISPPLLSISTHRASKRQYLRSPEALNTHHRV